MRVVLLCRKPPPDEFEFEPLAEAELVLCSISEGLRVFNSDPGGGVELAELCLLCVASDAPATLFC